MAPLILEGWRLFPSLENEWSVLPPSFEARRRTSAKRERAQPLAQCDLARQNATTCSSAVFIGEAGNSASASTAIAP